jgi:flagellar basal body-associated protein FliL
MPASVYDEPSAQHEQQRAQRLRKTARWILGVGTAVMMALGLVLLFLLTVATNNRRQIKGQEQSKYPKVLSVQSLSLLVPLI